jgi:hypothetical protein
MNERITLRAERDPRGFRSLTVRRDTSGDIVLEGHDLGSGVEEFWGSGHSEYEWVHTIPAGQDRRIREALGGVAGCDVFQLVAQWCEEHGEGNLVPTLEAAGVEVKFFSWVGTDWD